MSSVENDSKKSRYIPVDVDRAIKKRSKEQCECCGSMAKGDRHHIYEYHLGGKHTAENLIYLCASCHRDIPKYLTDGQQSMLQKWHIGYSKSISFNYDPSVEVYAVGTITFIGSQCIIKAGDQNIISVTFKNNKLYLNAVMLNNFKDKMLILSNRVITADKGITLVSTDNEISVIKNNNPILVINSSVKATNNKTGEEFNIPKIRGKIVYNEEQIQFDEQNVVIPGVISSAKGTVYENLDVVIDIESGITKLHPLVKKN